MSSTFSDNENIISGVSIQPSLQDIATDINYQYRYNQPLQEWSKRGSQNDATQAASFGKNYITNIDLEWIRDDATATDITERMLLRRKLLRLSVAFETTLSALTNDLLDYITVDHYNGPTLNTLTINQMTINLDNLSVSLVAKTENILWDDDEIWDDDQVWED